MGVVGRLVIGICNGFQVLVRTGLLPLMTMGVQQATLTTNDTGRFECRWVQLAFSGDSPCVFVRGLAGKVIELPIAHGEGRLVVNWVAYQQLRIHRLAPLVYHRGNPNGSVGDVAGLCDPTGRVFGLMPHPERFVDRTHHPNWRRFDYGKPHGLAIFENAIRFAQDL